MRFNRNVSIDDMKEMISAKIVKHCGRRISKLFYKFPLLTDPIKFTVMKLVDDEDVRTMVALCCGNQSHQNALIQLFPELVDVEPAEDPNPLREEHGIQDLCMVVPISYVDSLSTVHEFGIDLNVTSETNADGDDGYDSSDLSDHEVDGNSDPDVDEVSDDINDEDTNEDGNVNMSSVRNPIRCIVTHNDPRAHMLLMDPDVMHVVEFLEYPDILHAYRLAIDFKPEELFVGQKFETKEEYVFATKRYSMNVLEANERLQLTGMSRIYQEVVNVGDTKICWNSHMHFNTYDRRSPET
ncbi:hypothetical protein GOBAR_DD00024 [Gossypium barbadense]|nr:hypothetical protein GOBAR_DD00024 [Gossypium barbadense]